MGWQRSFTLTLEDMGNRTLSCLTWSPNGKTLAVGYTDGAIQLFGVETGASTRQHNWVYSYFRGRNMSASTGTLVSTSANIVEYRLATYGMYSIGVERLASARLRLCVRIMTTHLLGTGIFSLTVGYTRSRNMSASTIHGVNLAKVVQCFWYVRYVLVLSIPQESSWSEIMCSCDTIP